MITTLHKFDIDYNIYFTSSSYVIAMLSYFNPLRGLQTIISFYIWLTENKHRDQRLTVLNNYLDLFNIHMSMSRGQKKEGKAPKCDDVFTNPGTKNNFIAMLKPMTVVANQLVARTEQYLYSRS